MPRLLPAASSAVLIVGVGCGQISFGPLDGSGDPPDVSVEDAGLPDAEEVPDMGTPDMGPLPEDCIDPMAPTGWSDTPASMEWPFPRTSEAYQAVFWATARMSNCAAPACHGVTNSNPPLIPEPGGVTQNFEQAIDQLWEVVMASREGGWSTPLWAHHHESGNSAAHAEEVWLNNQIGRERIAFIQGFLDQAFGCYQSDWVADFSGEICTPDEEPPDAGVSPDAGDQGDGGDLDGGDGDGAVDAGSPPDAGERMCYCPTIPDVSAIDTSNCATN